MTDGNRQPPSWSEAPLSELTEVNPSRILPTCAPDALVNFVPMASVAEEFSGIDLSIKRPLREVQKGYTQFRESDVIVAKITPCMENGKLAIVPPLDSEVGYGSTEFHVLRPRNGVLSNWIAYFIAQGSFRRVAQRNMSGSAGQLRVPVSWLEEQVVPIAPPNEQTRITAKIEELFSDLDAGVAALERARANLKRYRAAVLKAAVEGKLTEQWRKAHPNVEPASKLLERILAERRRKWEETQLAKFAAAGKAPPKGWKDKYPEPAKPDTANLPELPEGWCWTHIEQLCEFGPHALKAGPFGSSIKKSMYVPSGYKIYGQEQVIRGDPYYGDYYIDRIKFEELKSCAIKPGDLLISLVGTIGRTLVLPEDCKPGIINPRLIKASLNQELVLPDFLQSYLKSPHVRAVFKLVSHGGTMEILNMGTLTALAYPLPPKVEQQAIMSEMATVDSVVDHVDSSFEGKFNTATRLRQSILKRAFEGKLVPQDPNDEPASALLERIRAARAAESPQRAYKRRKSLA